MKKHIVRHRWRTVGVLALIALMLGGQSVTAASIRVQKLTAAPVIDGSLADWDVLAAAGGLKIQTKPSTSSGDIKPKAKVRGDWIPELDVRAGVYLDTFYLAVQWADPKADKVYRPWKRRGSKYARSRKKDDILALRFQMSDAFADCMLAGVDYRVDLWRWSAGRSNLAGMADDMSHVFSRAPIEPSVVHETPEGSIYIQKTMDVGEPGWVYTRRPKGKGDDLLPAVAVSDAKSGSRADVVAKGEWHNGFWSVELSRKLEKSEDGDVDFTQAQNLVAQFAVFDASYKMRKRITDPVTFVFGDGK